MHRTPAPPNTPVIPPAVTDGAAFRRLAAGMFRYWWLAVGAVTSTVVAGLSLGGGLLTAKPVLDGILGAGKNLPQIATEFNARLADDYRALAWLSIPDRWIAAMPPDPMDAIVILLATACALTVVGSVANYLQAYLSLTLVYQTVTAARRRAFAAALRAPLRAVFSGSGPADSISRIINDSSKVTEGLTVLMSKAILQVVKGVASLGVALVLDWRVTVGALLVAPALYLVIRRLGKRIRKYSGRALESQAGLYLAAAESLQALRVVKVHTTELYEGGRFHRINKKLLGELHRVRTARALASPLMEMLSIFLLCGLILVAAKGILSGEVAAADFILAIGCLAVAGASLKPLSGILNDIQAAMPAARRLVEMIDVAPEPGHERGLPRLPRHATSVEFRNVSLTYPGAPSPAVRGVSLAIPRGSRVAFVGPNGCGKTTLLSLVPRLFDPNEGSVLIDGVDIRSVAVRSLRAQVGVVTQETVLFRDTIRRNIAYGRPGATDADVERAARMARAHEFILRLPQGYDAPVAEQGQSLSGGQRQRIAIARAILRDPAILILDEATSMIDAESEARIAEALDEFGVGRTCLIVAHRLSTVLTCDRIVVMDQGAILDQGSHQELVARCSLYADLARRQFLDPSA